MDEPTVVTVALTALALALAPAATGLAPGPIDRADQRLDVETAVEESLALTDELLDAQAVPGEETDAIAAWQTQILGLEPADPLDLEGYTEPSQALEALEAHHGTTLSAEERAELAALDEELHPEVAGALATFVDAFLAQERATEVAFADASMSQLAVLAASGPTPDDIGDPTAPLAGGGGPNPVAEAGVDLAPILSVRGQLAEAAGDLASAIIQHHEPANHDGCEPTQDEDGTYSIALETCDNHYEQRFALQVDAGGDDTYHNNAGGNNVAAACGEIPSAPVVLPPVREPADAVLLDVDGDDTYGDPTDPGRCGVNGGASVGTGLLIDAAGDDTYIADEFGVNGGGFVAAVGSLVDLQGADRYEAATAAANGGGYLGGLGSLVDGGGNDVYQATSFTSNGGATQGAGLIHDVAGDDTYTAGRGGVNGGASFDAVGFLLDEAGDDTYEAAGSGVNGGASSAVGHLIDLAGDDTYTAGAGGANGAAVVGLSTVFQEVGQAHGVLFDGAGDDRYEDGHIPGGSCEDCSLVPKGSSDGAQIDGDDPAVAASLDLPTDRPRTAENVIR